MLACSLPSAPVDPCTAVSPSTAALPPLAAYLARVPDHRDARGLRHPLAAVLAQVVCALLCGARHPTAITDWGRDHGQDPELLAALGYTRPQTPCGATMHEVLRELAWTALETQMRDWAAAVERHLTPEAPAGGEAALALDGKTLRGALKQGAAVVALVSALGHRLGLTAGVAEVTDGDEIAAVRTLLRELVLAGKVVTLDALHTQRETARLIGERGGHYVIVNKREN
jgi:DDE family transposase